MLEVIIDFLMTARCTDKVTIEKNGLRKSHAHIVLFFNAKKRRAEALLFILLENYRLQ